MGPLGPPVSDKVKVGRTNHVGQERSNWTYCQYKGHLTHIKETHKDCHMNLGQYFQIGHWLDKYGWTNYRGLDNYLKNPYHWTISQDILSNNKERNKDCPMNMDRRHFSSRTNTREMDNSNAFKKNFCRLLDLLQNMFICYNIINSKW